MTEQEHEDQMHKDPNNWKWHWFYYNPNDKRLFLPKRDPSFGITINFANQKAYLVFLVIFLFLGLVVFLVSSTKK
jgi:uncharacterized membrane protein